MLHQWCWDICLPLNVQVNPDEESRQRLKMIRGEIDEPMRSAAPQRTAQQELAEPEAAQAPAAADDAELGREAAESAAPAQPQAAPAEPAPAARDDDSDLDDEGMHPCCCRNSLPLACNEGKNHNAVDWTGWSPNIKRYAWCSMQKAQILQRE